MMPSLYGQRGLIRLCNDSDSCEISCNKKSTFYLDKNGDLIEYCDGCGHYTIYHKEGVNWINGPSSVLIPSSEKVVS